MEIGNRDLFLKHGQIPFFIPYTNTVEISFDAGPINHFVFDKYRAGIVVTGQTAGVLDPDVITPVMPVPGAFVGNGHAIVGGVIEAHIATGV